MKVGALVIDASHLAHRCWYAMPDIRTTDGLASGVVFGFLKTLKKLYGTLDVQKKSLRIVSVFDGGSYWKSSVDESYKANRQRLEPSYFSQLSNLEDLLSACGMTIVKLPNREADELIGVVVGVLLDRIGVNEEVWVVSSDRDFYQLISSRVKVFDDLRHRLIDTEAYKAQFQGLPPEAMLDVLSLSGKPSNNVKGIPKVGEKTAIKILKKMAELCKVDYISIPAFLKTENWDKTLVGKFSFKPYEIRHLVDRNRLLLSISTDIRVLNPSEQKMLLKQMTLSRWDKVRIKHYVRKYQLTSLEEFLFSLKSSKSAEPLKEKKEPKKRKG